MSGFFENMLVAAKQVAILYIIVAVGVLADRTNLFTEKTARLCTNLLFYIITPCVIVRSFLEIERTPEKVRGILVAIGCGLLMHTVASVLSLPLFRKGDRQKNSVLKFASVYGNCGYMALPLANAVVGAEGVFYASAVIMSFQIFAFTHGVSVMSRDNEGNRAPFKPVKLFLNPGTLSVLIGLPLFLLGVKLPEMVVSPVQYIASMNTPLAMLMFGTYISHTNLKTLKQAPGIALAGAFKLLVLPLTMIALFKLIGLAGIPIKGALLESLIISASAPSANNTVIFAAKYGRDSGFASQTVAVISLISIVTMPLLIALSSVI